MIKVLVVQYMQRWKDKESKEANEYDVSLNGGEKKKKKSF